MRIALVTTFYPPYSFGGDGIYVQRLARALAARGHDVEVIHDTDGYRALSGTDPVGDPPERDGTIRIHRLRARHPAWSALKVQQFGRPAEHRAEIARILSDRFDVIHYHNISLVGGPGVWALGSGIKLHTAHEHWLVCPTHVLWRYNRELCDARDCLRCTLSYRRPPQLWRHTGLIDREARHVDAFLTFSRSAAENHRRFGFGPAMSVVPSFLPDEPPIGPGEPPTRPYFMFVGRLEGIKGVDDIIPPFRDGLDADLLIAGTGEDEARLRGLAGGAPNIRFLGRLDAAELRPLYRDARAVLTPSRCYEVFPLVVLEAFREGTPVIARDLGPYPEIIDTTGGGLLFRDATDLAAALRTLLDAPDTAADMGARARAAFDATWSEEAAMAAYFGVIDGIAAHGRRDP